MVFKDFCSGAYTFADRKLAYQQCINLYPEANGETMTLQPVGGYEDMADFAEFTTGVIRGIYRTTRSFQSTNTLGSIVVVCGGKILWYKPLTDTVTTIGTISNASTSVDIIDDGNGVIIVDGELMYRIDIDTLDFTVIDFEEIKPTKLAVLNFRTIIIGNSPDDGDVVSNRFYYSEVADNSDWGANNYFELADVREPIIGITVSAGLLYLFSPNIYQVWQTNGSARKPFIKRSTGTDDIGLFANDSVSEIAGNVFFVGQVAQGTPGIYSIASGGPVKISTNPIDEDLSSTTISDCVSFNYSENGHIFIVFNFNTLDKTYVYDVVTSEWHTRAYRDDSGILHRWQPQYAINYNTYTILGSTDESKLYKYSKDIYTQSDSGEIYRMRSTPNIRNESRVIAISRFMVDTLVGRGIENSLQTPKLMMRYSKDGGYTWSSRIDQSVGATGDYTTEVEFRRLGVCKQLVIEISMSDSCAISLHGAYIYNKVSSKRG